MDPRGRLQTPDQLCQVPGHIARQFQSRKQSHR
jgi:hypothetical protein